MDGQSLDITAEKIAQLRAIFPEVFSEDKVDFARLKDVLGESAVFPGEHYELSWAGKAEARKEIQQQTTATLIPDRENSVNFDATGNIFIEGENAQVLRVLQKSYFGKIKMIYIDPPYNTGNDSFVYPDDYAERKADYNKRTDKTNGEGYLNKQDLWRKNTRENGQFHSVWLSMMYPRLYMARNLLREDGVIFVSCDDNEAADLKLLMDEVLGEENFIGKITVQSNPRGRQSEQFLATLHDYILIYAKSIRNCRIEGQSLTEEQLKEFRYKDGNGKYRLLGLRQRGSASRREDRPKMYYPIYINPDSLGISLEAQEGFTETVLPKKSDGSDGRWMWSDKKVLKNKHLIIPKLIEKRNEWDVFVKDYLEQEGDERSRKIKTIWVEKEFNTQNGTVEVKSLFDGNKYFDYPKPVDLIKKMITMANPDEDDIVLDFFAGSGTTAQAVLELNESGENGGNRQFICVQMPERLEEDSQAYKAGYRTIADICKARIQKVIIKLQTVRASELALNGNQQPPGFQAFRLAPSNFKAWRGDVTGEDILKQLEMHIHSEKENSEAEKMLYELLLKAGYPLTAKVESADIDGQAVYTVEDGKMLVFFDDYTPAINACVRRQKPQRVVCLDRVFKGNDEALTNFKLQLKEAGIELAII
jgi:adenine-specific DNA-methyltransferase